MGTLAQWTVARARLYRLDRNPLRRRTDRIEALAVVMSFLLFALSLGAVSMIVTEVYQRGVIAEQAGRWVTARLTRDAPATAVVPAYGGVSALTTMAVWSGPGGGETSTLVPVPAGAKAGTTVRLWAPDSGGVASGPQDRTETVVEATAAGFTAASLSAGVLLLSLAGVRWGLNRRRYAGWDGDWIMADRRWRRPEQGRPGQI